MAQLTLSRITLSRAHIIANNLSRDIRILENNLVSNATYSFNNKTQAYKSNLVNERREKFYADVEKVNVLLEALSGIRYAIKEANLSSKVELYLNRKVQISRKLSFAQSLYADLYEHRKYNTYDNFLVESEESQARISQVEDVAEQINLERSLYCSNVLVVDESYKAQLESDISKLEDELEQVNAKIAELNQTTTIDVQSLVEQNPAVLGKYFNLVL